MLTSESIAKMKIYEDNFRILLAGREVGKLRKEQLAKLIDEVTTMTDAQMLNLSSEQKATAFDA